MWISRPEGPPRGAVVVCHGGSGLTEHERVVIDRLAALGFVAVAPDLYEAPPTIERVKALVADPTELRRRVLAAVDSVREHGAVAVIGHCFGGTAALEAARSGADLACVVAFHGGLAAPRPAEPGSIRARVLVCAGAADPFCSREQRAAFEDEMTRAGAQWQLHVYGGAMHGFTVRGIAKPGCAYDARADRASWTAMLAELP